MYICDVCLKQKDEKSKQIFSCNHFMCKECYNRYLISCKERKVKINCHICRRNINVREKEIEKLEIKNPEWWLELDDEWVSFSRYLKNGTEIIESFKKDKIPSNWRNDSLTTIVKKRRKRKN